MKICIKYNKIALKQIWIYNLYIFITSHSSSCLRILWSLKFGRFLSNLSPNNSALAKYGQADFPTKYNINKMNCELMLTYDTPAYMFNVYKNQLSRQTGSRNRTGLKKLPTIWYTYMKLVTKYQISAINSCWEKYLGRTEGWTEVKQYTIPLLRWSGGIKRIKLLSS